MPQEAGAAAQRQLSYLSRLEQQAIALADRWFEPAARIAIFIIYFWFGILKAIGVSPATPLASALTAHTIGMQYFNVSFKALAVYECGLGIMFLIPALTRISTVLLVIHMGIVSSPLIIVANVAWTHPLVPTLEGQYIIKDLAIIALAIGLLARMPRDRQETEVRPQSVLEAARRGRRLTYPHATGATKNGVPHNPWPGFLSGGTIPPDPWEKRSLTRDQSTGLIDVFAHLGDELVHGVEPDRAA